jgi:pimeloyl-ACP methyl ester carboxylesterase
MRGCLRIVLILAGLSLLVVVIGPLVVPLPPLEDTVPPRELADADSLFAEVDGLEVHYKVDGEGVPALVLLHGFAASAFSWRKVAEPLGELGSVIAFDRPAFGLTERPLPDEGNGQNPYSPEAQSDLTVALMDELGVDKAVLVGHSAGGTIAALTALRHPERVEALVLEDAAIYRQGGTPSWLRPMLLAPQMRRLGPVLVRSIATWGEGVIEAAWDDPEKITVELLSGYKKPLRAENWDRALWEFTLASHPLALGARLQEITVPVLVITGDNDRIVPTAESERLAEGLPHAELVVIPRCGHVPHEECPGQFLDAVTDLVGSLP